MPRILSSYPDLLENGNGRYLLSYEVFPGASHQCRARRSQYAGHQCTDTQVAQRNTCSTISRSAFSKVPAFMPCSIMNINLFLCYWLLATDVCQYPEYGICRNAQQMNSREAIRDNARMGEAIVQAISQHYVMQSFSTSSPITSVRYVIPEPTIPERWLRCIAK